MLTHPRKLIHVLPEVVALNEQLRQEAEPGWEDLLVPPIKIVVHDPRRRRPLNLVAYEVKIMGPSDILYNPAGGGIDNARVWLETTAPLKFRLSPVTDLPWETLA